MLHLAAAGSLCWIEVLTGREINAARRSFTCSTPLTNTTATRDAWCQRQRTAPFRIRARRRDAELVCRPRPAVGLGIQLSGHGCRRARP